MAACFRCRIRKLTCSRNSPVCKQCLLASAKCKYGRPNRINSVTQHKRKRMQLSSLAYSNKRRKRDRTDSEDTSTEAGDGPLCHADPCLPSSAQDFEGGSVYPSIEVLPEDPQTAQRDLNLAPRNEVPYLQQERRPIYTSVKPLGPSRSPFVLMKSEMRSVVFYEFEINDAIVQYLLEPTGQSIPDVVSSNVEWENKLRATVHGMLVGVPLGEPIVSAIGAPFIGNQYAGEHLDFVVSWQKCFLAARMVDKCPRKEITDARKILLQKVEEFVTGKLEKVPMTLDVTKIPQLLSSVNTTLYNSDHVDLRETPQVEIRKVNLQFSPPPPPAIPLPPIIPDGSPNSPLRWGDAVLVSHIDNGRRPDIAREAAMKPLASDHEKDSAVKQTLMTATRLLRKMGLKMGLAGWRKEIKEYVEDEIEDRVEMGVVEEKNQQGFSEGTDEDMEAFIKDCIEEWVEEEVQEGVWKESGKVGGRS